MFSESQSFHELSLLKLHFKSGHWLTDKANIIKEYLKIAEAENW